jgi:ribonuclease HII
MLQYHELYPQYGFAENKGYLTEAHLTALKRFGPCPVHRRSYEPIRLLLRQTRREQQLSLASGDLGFG